MLRRLKTWFRFNYWGIYGYDGRYGHCIGIAPAPIDGGMAIWMSDGTKHYVGDKARMARWCLKAFFFVYVCLRRSF